MNESEWENACQNGYEKSLETEEERIRYESLETIIRSLPVHQSILDVGCGAGLMRKYLPDLDYTGIDISESAIEKEKALYSGRFLCADADTWCPEEQFDVILFNESFYYLHDPLKCIETCFRCCRPNGFLVFSVWLPPEDHPRYSDLSSVIEQLSHQPSMKNTVLIKNSRLRWKSSCCRKKTLPDRKPIYYFC